MPDAPKNSPSRRGRWRRRLGFAALGALLLAAGAVATADWWLPALAARVVGLEAAARETRWGDVVSWREARWADAGLAITAGSVRLDAPSRIARAGATVGARIEDWELVVVDTEAETTGGDSAETAAAPFGWPELHAVLVRTGRELERWVGEVELQNGRVRVAEEIIELPMFSLKGGRATGSLQWRGEGVEFEIDLTVVALELRAPARDASASLRATASSRVDGAVRWAGNTAELEAEFAAGVWRPRALRATGREWVVPAELFGRGAEYGALRGGFEARVDGDSVGLVVDAVAAPRADGFPPVRISAEASADLERFSLARLELSAPGLEARLSAPIAWRRGQGWAMDGEPEFAWTASLPELSEGRVPGRLSGAARWRDGEVARVDWEARAEGLAWADFSDVSAGLQGTTTATETRIASLEAGLADGARLRASGLYRHAEKRVEGGKFEAELSSALLARWVPEGWRVERASLDGTMSGEWPGLAVEARARAEAGAARLALEGAWVGGRDAVTLGQAELTRADGAALRLLRPAAIQWTPGARGLDAAWAGVDARLELAWRDGGDARVRIENLDTTWISEWRTGPAWPAITVRELALSGRPDEAGWAAGEASLDLLHPASGWTRVEGSAGAGGVELRRLEIGRNGEVLAVGEGRAPWRWRVNGGRSPVDDGMWSLRLESKEGATLWDELARVAGLELEQPTLRLAVDGPAREPTGRAELTAGRIVLRGEGAPDGGLELRGLVAAGSITPGEIAVQRLAATVDGQRVEASGRVALGADGWAKLRARPLAFLRDHAEARISLPEAQVAALARHMPTMLAPSGTVAAELRLSPGANLDGVLRLNGGATRPLGAFGVLQQIDVELALAGRDVSITRMRAQAGGQAVEITGAARRDPGRMPALDLRVRAERFPLVRRPGLLLRGDLDLAIQTLDGRTRVSGEVGLRDSLFLADIRPLVSSGGGGGSGAPSRPPYFSVDTRPLADWELAVRVGGSRFLRMRTPVFAGVTSARFDLTGTLREPRAVGEAWVEDGSILFPFASFAVQTGAVRLRAGDPYTPLLEFRASGRRLGYDLRLELAGTAESPQLQLFSSPPLEAERLLLMITAGAAPLDGQGAASTTQRLAAVGAYVGRDLLRTLGVASSDEERLTLRSGERVSRQGRETFGFEFKLNDKWSLAGEYDEFDAYNAGLRRRLQGRPPQANGEKEEAGDAR